MSSTSASPLILSPAVRQENLQALAKERFDLAVIGGGITGAGIAREAAARGLKTVVVDKGDFGSGTSSRSSKLVHGGLRYLKQFELKIVRTSLLERYYLLHQAPHLVKKLPFLLPIYRHDPDGYLKMDLGLWVYDLLCGTRHLGYHHMLSAPGLLKLLPQVRPERLRGGGLYYDAQGDDFRLVLANLQSAALQGCRLINYLAVVGFAEEQGRVCALNLQDTLSQRAYRLRAKVFVNATGPWNDSVRRLADPGSGPRLRNTAGIHLVVPRERLPLNSAVMIISALDRRTLFAIPWQQVVILGTTDTDYEGDPAEVTAGRSDVDYLLASFNAAFPGAHLADLDILSTYAGVRPLVLKKGIGTSEVSREHDIFEGPRQVFNIIGGKLTTYHRMAVELLAYVARHCPSAKIPGRAAAQDPPLYGGEDFAGGADRMLRELREHHALAADIAENLLGTYGLHADEVLARSAPDGCERILPGLPYLWAQVDFAVGAEMAQTLEDVLMRRLHVLWFARDHGRAIAPAVAQRIGMLLGWDAGERERAVRSYLAQISRSEKFLQTA